MYRSGSGTTNTGDELSDDERPSFAYGLLLFSIVLAAIISYYTFFLWAYAGSEHYLNLIFLGVPPWVGVWALFARRYALGGAAFATAGMSLLLGGLFVSRWGVASILLSGIPFGMAAVYLFYSRRPVRQQP